MERVEKDVQGTKNGAERENYAAQKFEEKQLTYQQAEPIVSIIVFSDSVVLFVILPNSTFLCIPYHYFCCGFCDFLI